MALAGRRELSYESYLSQFNRKPSAAQKSVAHWYTRGQLLRLKRVASKSTLNSKTLIFCAHFACGVTL